MATQSTPVIKNQGSTPTQEKALRSKKLYWVLGTTAVALGLFVLYYSLYVSSQQAYYNDRAFRLLSTMGDKLVMDLKIIGDVLAAASSKTGKEEASDYAQQTMHGVWGPRDFEVTDLSNPKSCPTHHGTLALTEAGHADGFRVYATYKEPASAANTPAAQLNRCPEASAPLVISANINLDPLVRPALSALSEDFFDDVWIADVRGTVWFQQSQDGIRVQSIRAVLASQGGSSSWNPFSKPTAPAVEGGAASSAATPGNVVHPLGLFSQERNIVLAGSEYKLFLQPLPVTVQTGKEEQRLVLCGLRSAKRAQAQALALPYTYLIWGILATLAVFAVSWPLLKLLSMSPKERLRGRQLFYLAFSIVLATAALTLIALNVSYALTSGDASQTELQHLAYRVKSNLKAELRFALSTLDDLAANAQLREFITKRTISPQPSVCDLPPAEPRPAEPWNQANFLCSYGQWFLRPDHPLAYPYFRYFFIADREGFQQLKFTVNAEATPQVNVSHDPYFHPVIDCELSHLPKAEDGTETHDFVMQPLHSPNTGEFLVALAAPYRPPCKTDAKSGPRDLSVKVLGIKLESLFNPVVPLGYGYAIVDSQGRVLFHSVSVRNLAENFTKETQDDVSLQALLAEGTSDGLSTRYLGAQKQLWVTPIEGLKDLRLTLIVFKDTKYFTTVNAAVNIVFSLLLGSYAIFLFAGILIYMYVKREYPLQSIWPNPYLRLRYLHITVANIFLVAAFFWRYGAYQVATALWAVTALIFTAALCALLERSSRRRLVLADLLVLGVLFGLSGATWVIVHFLLYAVIAFYPPARNRLYWLFRGLKLDLIYTLMTASVLLILVVAPGCGFFKVSYDFVQRLFLQREQLDLATKIGQRNDTIEDYYVHHPKASAEKSEQFATLRENLDWDRYDLVFLNRKPAGSFQQQGLSPTWFETYIAGLTGWFPSNALGAELRELARGTTPPGLDWSLRRYSSDAPEAPPSLVLSGSSGEAVISSVKVWPSLDWRVRIPVALIIAILLVWIHFVHRRIFLGALASLPPLPKWRPDERDACQLSHDLLIIAHPKSGKRSAARMVEGAHHVDLATMVTTGAWNVGQPLGQVIVLSHFEFDIDNPKTNLKKLHLLEDLVYVQRKRIILLSTIDPMFYLSAGGAEVNVPGKEKDLDTAIQTLDRWASVLARFRKLTIDDVTKAGLRQLAAFARSQRTDRPFRTFVHQVVKECDHTAQLRITGAAILISRVLQSVREEVAGSNFQEIQRAVRSHRPDERYREYADWVIRECTHKGQRLSPVAVTRAARRRDELSKETLIEELLDRGDAYYRVLWSTCTRDERLVLYQLAKDGWANPKNEMAIQQLQRRNLVTKLPGLRLMNDSFRHFVLEAQYRDEIASWQQEGDQSLWRSLRMSLGILAVAVAAWLLYSQQQFFNTVVGYVGAIGGATGVIIKLFSELRGGKASPGSSP